MRQNTKTIVGNVATGASSVTAEFDTLGFNFVKFIHGGNGTNLAVAASAGLVIVESDTSGGTTNAITGFVQGTDFTASTVTTHLSTLAKSIACLDLRGRKRYIKVSCASSTTTNAHFLIAELSNPGDGISNAAEAGATVGVGF
jgi:hypothetical protein